MKKKWMLYCLSTIQDIILLLLSFCVKFEFPMLTKVKEGNLKKKKKKLEYWSKCTQTLTYK